MLPIWRTSMAAVAFGHFVLVSILFFSVDATLGNASRNSGFLGPAIGPRSVLVKH